MISQNLSVPTRDSGWAQKFFDIQAFIKVPAFKEGYGPKAESFSV